MSQPNTWDVCAACGGTHIPKAGNGRSRACRSSFASYRLKDVVRHFGLASPERVYLNSVVT
ncbi:MAG: hypothetical protein ACJ788_23080 [Ktedonobacteraceae bacterium]